MLKFAVVFLSCLIYQEAAASVIDVLESYNGHEPSVAVKCGRVPFYIDQKSGSWVVDEEKGAVCDNDKNEVKKYCQKVYPQLNITNIVEANKAIKLTEWCRPGQIECAEKHKVVPYRCLVDEYEADALLVPRHCRFGHLHDASSCMGHDAWRDRAANNCFENGKMRLKEYGILLGCDTDKFTGVEFVCCPDKHHKNNPKKNLNAVVDIEKLGDAVEKLQGFLPEETAGCDRSAYSKKKEELEERHRTRIASVVDEWDEAETRYKKLKNRDIKIAERKMNSTLKVFRETLKALEDEAKEERSQLRDEHAKCISVDINNTKRQTMLSYIASVEEKPHSPKKILKAVRGFIQACEHDRLHSLRHFEHIRNQDPTKAATMRAGLLKHLQELNTVVNQSINLLAFLPDVASMFGLTTPSDGGVLKPRVTSPKVLPEEIPAVSFTDDEFPGKSETDHERPLDTMNVGTRLPTDEMPDEMPKTDHDVKSSPLKPEGWEDFAHAKPFGDDEAPQDNNHPAFIVDKNFFKRPRSPAAFAAVIGLSCGALVIILGSIVALVMRRRHPTHVIVSTDDDDEREHLVKMQKNGYENPTYKFFYY